MPDEKDKEVVCENCDKKTQKDLPEQDKVASPGMPCSEAYRAVSSCMDKYNGQIHPCAKEWDVFRACHEENK